MLLGGGGEAGDEVMDSPLIRPSVFSLIQLTKS